METQEFISIQLFSLHYNVPVSFMNALYELELINITSVKETLCIHKSQIKEIEQIIRLHYDLDINLEGIDAIYNLLKRIELLQQDIITLKNKLNRFESH